MRNQFYFSNSFNLSYQNIYPFFKNSILLIIILFTCFTQTSNHVHSESTDPDNRPLPDNSGPEQTIETLKPIVQMAIYQEIKKNPDIYYSFEYASKGKKGIEDFEALQSAKRKERDIDYMNSNVNIGVSAGIISMEVQPPDINQLEAVQYQRHRKSFFEFQEEFPYLSQKSKQITDIMFLCGTGSIHFDCPAFDDYFKNAQIDSSELKESFTKALEYAQQYSSRWPVSTDLESLFLNNPNEAHIVWDMKNAQNLEDFSKVLQNIENQLDQIQNNAEKQNTNTLTEFEKYIEKLQDQIDQNQQELSSNTQLTQVEIRQHLQTQNTLANIIKEMQKQKELDQHKRHMSQFFAYVEAATAVAQVLNAPPEVIKMGKAVGIGIKIFDAAKSMLISGALDPTGITAIAQGAVAIISIIANTPSPEQIMIDKLNEILNNQRDMLIQLRRMEKKIDRLGQQLESALDTIINHFDELEIILRQDHREIMEKLNSIQTNLKYGFDFISYKIDKQTHNDLMREAKGLYKQHLSSVGSRFQQDLFWCRLDIENCTTNFAQQYLLDTRKQLTEMSEYSKDMSEEPSLKKTIHFSTLPLTEIKEYLNRVVEDRLEIFEPIREWLNIQINNSEIIPQWINSHFESNITTHIENISPFPKIGNPYFQDENFFEAVQLATTVPIEYHTLSNDPIHNTEINQICQHSKNIQNTSYIMRENIHKAWVIYWLYSQIVKEKLAQSFNNHLNQYGLLEIQKNIAKALHVIKTHYNLAFFLLNDWTELQEHLDKNPPHNKCTIANIVLKLAQAYSLTPPHNFINFVTRNCPHSNKPIPSTQLNFFSHCSGDKYIDIYSMPRHPHDHEPNVKFSSREWVLIGRSASTDHRYSRPTQTIIGSSRKCHTWNQYNPDIRNSYLDLRQYKNILPSKFFSNFYNYLNKRIQDQIDNNDIALIGWGFWNLTEWIQTHEVQSDCLEWQTKSRQELCEEEHSKTWRRNLSPLLCFFDSGPGGTNVCVSYGPLYKKKLRIPIKHTALITPNKSAFIQANNDYWGISLKQFYKKILEDLNKNDLLTNWMRAMLAFDTIARGAYGNLIEHSSSLSSLKTVLSDLSIIHPPNITFYNNKKPLNETERENIIQFLKDIESVAVIPDTTNWFSKNLLPQCETQNDRIAFTLSQTGFLMNELKNEKQENFSENTLQKALNTLQSIREKATNNRETLPINKEKFLRYITKIEDARHKAHEIASRYDQDKYQDQFQEYYQDLLQTHIESTFSSSLLSHPNRRILEDTKNSPNPIPDFYSYTDTWELPLCDIFENNQFIKISMERSPIHSIVYHFSDCMMYGYDYCLFNKNKVKVSLEKTLSVLDIAPVIPLPPETAWENTPVGMGFPLLRNQAFLTASQLPHFYPKNCSINESLN